MKKWLLLVVLVLAPQLGAAVFVVSNDSTADAFFIFKQTVDLYGPDAGYVVVRKQSTYSIQVPEGAVAVIASNDGGFSAGGVQQLSGDATVYLPSNFSSDPNNAYYSVPGSPPLPFTLPEGINTREGMAFLCGFFLMALVRIFRAALKWFKRAGTERFD